MQRVWWLALQILHYYDLAIHPWATSGDFRDGPSAGSASCVVITTGSSDIVAHGFPRASAPTLLSPVPAVVGPPTRAG